MKLRIVKLAGEPVTYREALLRFLPTWAMGVAVSCASIVAVLSIADADYVAAGTFVGRSKLMLDAMPSWSNQISVALNVWVWSEFVVLLFNEKRRAFQDFIAGTVVIRDTQPAARNDEIVSSGSV